MGTGGFTAKLKKKLSLGGVTLWGAALFVFLIVFDLATKALAEKYLADGRAVKIVGDFVVLSTIAAFLLECFRIVPWAEKSRLSC